MAWICVFVNQGNQSEVVCLTAINQGSRESLAAFAAGDVGPQMKRAAKGDTMEGQGVGFKLSGWKAVAGLVLLIVIVGIRIATIGGEATDPTLMEKVKFELMTEYFPDDADRLKALHESGNEEALARAVESVTTTELHIKSIKTSASLFSLLTKNDKIIVKVDYSLDDAQGTRRAGTRYYRFKHSPMLNIWEFQGTSFASLYYLNFL
jgi:hypothetical protein